MVRSKSMTVVLAGSLVMAVIMMTTIAGASTPGVTSKTITLGLITELTGPGAAVGTGMVRAADARSISKTPRVGSLGARSSSS